MHRLKASFVIPAYNEEQNLAETVEELLRALVKAEVPHEILLVNDNSTDGTAAVLKALEVEHAAVRTVHRTPPNGFGRAVRTGLEYVTGDVVIIYMADKSDDPADALKCYRKIEEGYDCAFGSRFRPGSVVEKYPKGKLIANRIVNKCIQWMFWCPFNDLTNAFKVYRTDVVRECGPFRASHFNITIEMSLSALVHRYRIAEVPISWYGRTWGSSNLRLGEMGRRYLSVLLKMFFERMLVGDDILADRLAHQEHQSLKVSDLQSRIESLEKRMGEGDGGT